MVLLMVVVMVDFGDDGVGNGCRWVVVMDFVMEEEVEL